MYSLILFYVFQTCLKNNLCNDITETVQSDGQDPACQEGGDGELSGGADPVLPEEAGLPWGQGGSDDSAGGGRHRGGRGGYFQTLEPNTWLMLLHPGEKWSRVSAASEDVTDHGDQEESVRLEALLAR